ncbi:MAG: EamA family transporter [Candidatus Woesearchaeota archaeon]
MNRGVKLVLATAIISGFAIFLNSFGVKGIDSSIFTFSKNILVAIFLLSTIFFLKQFKELKSLTKKSWLKLALIGLIGGSIPFLLFFKGLQLATGPTSAFIHKTLFIYATILAFIFLKEKLNWKITIPTILLLIGNYFLLKINAFNFGKGELLILIATLFWATENILSKHTLKELSGNLVAFGRMAFGSLFILIFLITTNKTPLLLSLQFNQILWTLATSILLLLFVTTYYNGLKTIKVTTATSILLLGSPITLLLNLLLLGKAITILQVTGMLLTTTGVLFIIYFFEKSTQETISTA